MPLQSPPPALLRYAVILGGLALLVGVAGIFYFQVADRTRAANLPLDACMVSVRGLETLEGVQLRARWQDLDGEVHEETGKPTADGGTWRFERTPEGVPLTVEVLVHGKGERVLRHAQPAVLTRGGLFDVWLPDGR
ncbi:MAG: hypothetical protein O2894_04995 [Planctomycetota bacterium]|nr:hypothetical protein [Planctomycetota bacterium]